MVAGLQSARPVAGRQDGKQLANGAVLIDDSYNANPGSVLAGIAALTASCALDGRQSLLVLGDMAEASFRQSMLLSQGSLSIFWSNPLVGSIFGLAILLLLWPLWSVAKDALGRRKLSQ